MSTLFKIFGDLQPCGDQPQAIEKITQNIKKGSDFQTLLGVTGSGKTFTMAQVVARVQKPTLVLAPNKTLAAQLYSEFKSFFPENAVGYFVSYYDYYQPEAYIPRTDLYIEKDSSINDDIDKMRHAATHALLTRSDVLIVASVSCIYGLGSPEAYNGMLLDLDKGMTIQRKELIQKLIEIQYERNDLDFHRGTFRVRGDLLDVFPAYEDAEAVRIEFFEDEIERILVLDPLTGKTKQQIGRVAIYPASHYVTPPEVRDKALEEIRFDLVQRLEFFDRSGRVLEKQRLEQRTRYDLEMIEEMGFCQGIENYSRYFDGRKAGEAPPTLFSYFPKDFLLFVDESHISIPQIHGMYKGDRARKETLVEYGFRLPSALDNRPLTFAEFEKSLSQVVFVSATPGDYELEKSGEKIIEQVIRPTGLVDPEIFVRQAEGQVEDLIRECLAVIEKKERVLVTTLTKRMAENLQKFLTEAGIKCRYLHSDIETVERFEILRDLRLGVFDVLIGINLLREGLDLPEVSLVAILDGDKEGFLRSTRSLIQTFGRAARNVSGRVIVYADRMTGSLQGAIDETNRRRKIQQDHNIRNQITPQTVVKNIPEALYQKEEIVDSTLNALPENMNPHDLPKLISSLKQDMEEAAKNWEFEKAATLRDQLKKLKELQLAV